MNSAKLYETAINIALKAQVKEDEYVDLLETIYAELCEITIDPLNTHKYEKTSEYTWDFIDRVNNHMRVLILPFKNDIKTAYVIKNAKREEVLVYDKDKLSNEEREKIVDLPDERRINTIYKIIIKEILPKYLLSNKPSKISFTPISKTRERLVTMIFNKIIKDHPNLEVKGKYLVNK